MACHSRDRSPLIPSRKRKVWMEERVKFRNWLNQSWCYIITKDRSVCMGRKKGAPQGKVKRCLNCVSAIPEMVANRSLRWTIEFLGVCSKRQSILHKPLPLWHHCCVYLVPGRLLREGRVGTRVKKLGGHSLSSKVTCYLWGMTEQRK